MKSKLLTKVLSLIIAIVTLISASGVYATWRYASSPVQNQMENVIINANNFMYYDEVVIMGVETISNSSESENTYCEQPTSLKSTITGNSGQKIVYKITAHNFSNTKSFVYAGASYDSNTYNSLKKLTVSASQDENNLYTINHDVLDTYYEGVAIAPGEDFTFYVTYTLIGKISNGELLINYLFKPIIYTITYLNNNQTFAVEHITNNGTIHYVKSSGPQHESLVFAGWVNANAVVVKSIPVGNTNNYTLSASWDNVYLIIFADANGEILYEEQFTESSTKLSNEGQIIVDQILSDLNEEAAKEEMSVSWSEYDIASATSDITVKAIYTYEGVLNLVPVYEEPDDGIVDYYKITAVDTLPSIVEVPGYIGGIPVKVIERITNEDGSSDWDNFEKNVTTIIINEGVERLEHNSLAWTPNLSTVQLPSTINYLGKNTFSRNIALGGFGRGDDKKVLTIEFNGTKAQWKAILANSDSNWDGGLKKGSVIRCTDGYFELDGSLSLSWKEKSY